MTRPSMSSHPVSVSENAGIEDRREFATGTWLEG